MVQKVFISVLLRDLKAFRSGAIEGADELTRETPSAVNTQPEEHNERTEHTAVYNSSSWVTLQQLSSSKMVVEPLLLNYNQYVL